MQYSGVKVDEIWKPENDAGGCKAQSGSRTKPWSGVEGAPAFKLFWKTHDQFPNSSNECCENWFWCKKKRELSFIVINIFTIPALSQKISQHIKKITLMTWKLWKKIVTLSLYSPHRAYLIKVPPAPRFFMSADSHSLSQRWADSQLNAAIS